MEGEMHCRPVITTSMLGTERLQIDLEGSSRRDIEPSDLHKMPKQLPVVKWSYRWRLLLEQRDDLMKVGASTTNSTSRENWKLNYFSLGFSLSEIHNEKPQKKTKHIRMTENFLLNYVCLFVSVQIENRFALKSWKFVFKWCKKTILNFFLLHSFPPQYPPAPFPLSTVKNYVNSTTDFNSINALLIHFIFVLFHIKTLWTNRGMKKNKKN